jgi:sugar lactone lactonase YvrE
MKQITTIKIGMMMLLAVWGVSCSDDASTINVAGVTLEPDVLVLPVNADGTLVATVLPEDASDKTITWSSSDPTIASVTDGKVLALKIGGPVTITVTTQNGNKSATCAVTVREPQLMVSTLAGAGTDGYLDGVGKEAMFSRPNGLTVDGSGNIYVGSKGCIRKITPEGIVTTLAGNSESGYADGSGTEARFREIMGLAVDATGNVYAADFGNYAVRKISPAGIVTTLAGNGISGSLDDVGQLGAVADLVLDPSGEIIYLTDETNHCVRKLVIATGVVTTLAGNGVAGRIDGTGTKAGFSYPRGLAIDARGYLYVGEYYSHAIRKVTPAGVVTTYAGTGEMGYFDGPSATALFNYPSGLLVDDSGNLYVADQGNRCIRQITPQGIVITLAGGERDYIDGPISTARFDSPIDIAISKEGIIYVCEAARPCIRKIALE